MFCRVCAQQHQHLIPIFSTVELSIDVKLRKLLSLEVDPSDVLPKEICLACFNKINGFHEFVMNTIQAQLVLNIIYNVKDKPAEIVEIKKQPDKSIQQDGEAADELIEEEILEEILPPKTEATEVEVEVEEAMDAEEEEMLVEEEATEEPVTIKVLPNEDKSSDDQHIEDDPADVIDEEQETQEFTLIEYEDNGSVSADEDKNEMIEILGASDDNTKRKHSYRTEFRQLVCIKCDDVCGSSKELISHYATVHKTNTTHYKCIYCETTFEKYRSFTRHVINHSEPPRFKCELCQKAFTQKVLLHNHYLTHGNEKLFKCDLCPLSFKHMAALYQHKRNIHSGLKFICDFCNDPFQSPLTLKEHKKAKHLDIKDRICPICGKGYASAPAYHYHMKTHNKRNQECRESIPSPVDSKARRKHACKECKKNFMTLGMLKRHIALTHKPKEKVDLAELLRCSGDTEIDFMCDICGINFPNREEFEVHFEDHRIIEEQHDAGQEPKARRSAIIKARTTKNAK